MTTKKPNRPIEDRLATSLRSVARAVEDLERSRTIQAGPWAILELWVPRLAENLTELLAAKEKAR